jgi:hypothetical protein
VIINFKKEESMKLGKFFNDLLNYTISRIVTTII